jgi:ribonucleotide monophosphatase NagD (HAD superfamily)
VLAVGDSLRTDIAGAIGVDLAACWVLDGIHGAALRASDGTFDTARAEAAAREAGVVPTVTLPQFVW